MIRRMGWICAALAVAGPVLLAAEDGEQVYRRACFACHDSGAAGAPKLGDEAAWAQRLGTGAAALGQSVIKGKGVMPPRAGNPSLTDAAIQAAVDYMLQQVKQP